MDSTYSYDVSLSIDMDDLGVRPNNELDFNKSLDDPITDFFGKEKTIDFTVYSAEVQFTNNKTKITTNDDETFMSEEDDNSNHYDIDPETGEKIFREVNFTSHISFSSSNDKWIEEYLSNIEFSSNQILPTTTTTTTNSEFNFENLSFSSVDNPNEQTGPDWLSNLIELEENSTSMIFADSIMPNDFPNENQITTTMNQPTLNVLIDDEYSASDSSVSSSHQRTSMSSLESGNEIQFIEAKLEKIEPNEDSLAHMMVRRSSTRSVHQGQQDEDALHLYNIPLTLADITQSSTEEYNRHLVRLSHLTSEQMHIIKDIRRRGKNKVAAQNCRKRKAIGVEALLEEVDELKRVKHELEERKRAYEQQIAETRHQYEYLHRQVLPDRQLPPAIIVK